MSSAPDWLARVREALDRTDIMVVSSLRTDGSPWSWPVQFRHTGRPGGGMDLRFSSLPTADHVEHLAADPRVAVAVFAVPGPPGGNLGLQLAGRAEQVSEGGGWLQFRIQVQECHCFDSRVSRQPQPVDLTRWPATS